MVRMVGCQEIGLVAFMFFFELFIFLCSSQFPSMFSLTNLFSIILFPYLLITRDCQGYSLVLTGH